METRHPLVRACVASMSVDQAEGNLLPKPIFDVIMRVGLFANFLFLSLNINDSLNVAVFPMRQSLIFTTVTFLAPLSRKST